MSKYPLKLQTLSQLLKKLPGIGSKTAERLAFELVKWPEGELGFFGETLASLKENLFKCPECQALIDQSGCPFCRRSSRQICLLASAKDLFALEETAAYSGLYFVLDHLLSPLKSCQIEEEAVQKLENLISKHSVEEVIIALDSTLEGDATALFFKNRLKKFPHLKISRLAFGLPVGSSLEYVDEGTLTRSFMGRQNF
ncbi:MAG: recombination mediator RecR [Parachlamydiales bacterium]|jgi:recombination protein RecR